MSRRSLAVLCLGIGALIPVTAGLVTQAVLHRPAIYPR